MVEKAIKIITVFGSSRSSEGDADYDEARKLGRLLAQAGFTICSGGFGGSMEAVSRGAREGGGRTIGVTVDLIRRSANPWLDEEVRTETIFRRIEHMVTIAHGFVALRGGAGTLAEMALTMNLLFLEAL
ncbi:MAG TPA: LOG family protein, partial [Chloroflexota bacterium]|nr:LOG family protein [Chloroflexota bacterium]